MKIIKKGVVLRVEEVWKCGSGSGSGRVGVEVWEWECGKCDTSGGGEEREGEGREGEKRV